MGAEWGQIDGQDEKAKLVADVGDSFDEGRAIG
jgi:hypothetical protein